MAFDKGWNFRGSTGFVTDGGTETYVIATDTYPITRNGITFGYASGGAGFALDRDASNDRRIAGTHANSAASVFQIDLPSTGDYLIYLGLGDTAQAADHSQIDFKDNTTLLFSVTNDRNVGTYKYTDATGTQYAFTAWPGSQAGVQKTFASSTMNCSLTTPDGFWTVNHIAISQVAGAAAPNLRLGFNPEARLV